jgi:RHS repeat-associated protein
MTVSRTYGAYGENSQLEWNARSAYAGERVEAATGCYMLGNRQYSPVLRRFHNSDPVSPFDDGGLNRYAYCSGDPINRVDPSGNSWLSWLFAALGPPGASIGAASHPGTLAASGGSATSGQTNAIAMPTTVTLAAAVLSDALEIAAGVGSVAPGDGRAGNIFGWLTSGSGASSGSTLSLKANSPAARFVGQQWGQLDVDAPRYKIDVVRLHQIPPDKFRYSARDGVLKINTRWVRRTDPLDVRVSHWGADTIVSTRKLAHPLKRIGRMPVAEGNDNVYLYSGAHGNPRGENWNNGKRQHEAHRFYLSDLRHMQRYASYLPGRNLSIESITDISMDQMIEKMSRPGVHVHAYCFGAVDELVLAVLDASPVPVYVKT